MPVDKEFKKGLTIKAGTKSMDRGTDRPVKVKVIPRSNEAFQIVPLPLTEKNFSDRESNTGAQRFRKLGMLRTDI